MAETQMIGIRCPKDLLERIDSLKGTAGSDRTEVILNLIRASLGVNVPSSPHLEGSTNTMTVITQQIDELDEKVFLLNESFNTVKQGNAALYQEVQELRAELASMQSPVSNSCLAPAKQPKPIASDRPPNLMTTQEAYLLATERGYTKSQEAFRSWSKRNPQECERLYSLRRLNNSLRDNTAPSYEDVRNLSF